MRKFSVMAIGCVVLAIGYAAVLAGLPLDGRTQPSPQSPDKPERMETVSPNQSETIYVDECADAQPVKSDWRLVLVNRWNPLPEQYNVTLKELSNGQAVDERCYPDLQEMMDDCRAAGLQPLICSSYRTWEYQDGLFQDKVNRLAAMGYSMAEATEKAGTEVAVPGTSEHQLGLAVDIVDITNQNLDDTQEQTDVQMWLMENSWKYGFILRYPNEKSEFTGIIYEPWHYRYVGKEAAEEIFRKGICLEEYLDLVP